MFYDLGVRAFQRGVLEVAKRFGYAGIAVLLRDEDAEVLLKGAVVRERGVFYGVEIFADSISEMKDKVRAFSGKVDVLAVHSRKDEKFNRAVLSDFRVDMLTKAVEAELSAVCVRYAAENAVALEFNMDAIFKQRRKERAIALSRFREMLTLVRKFKAMVVLTSNALSPYDLRAPREMLALSSLFGMNTAEAKAALSEIPEGILSKRWKREREKGVEILTVEELEEQEEQKEQEELKEQKEE